MTVPLLSVHDIAKAFGGVQALAGVSFDVAAGECVAVIGPNGAGKTTLTASSRRIAAARPWRGRH